LRKTSSQYNLKNLWYICNMKFYTYLSSNNIFCYCGAGFDFEPLVHLSHTYSDFYYVDNNELWSDIDYMKNSIVDRLTRSYKGRLEFISFGRGDLHNNLYPYSNLNENIIKSYTPKIDNNLWKHRGFQELNDQANYHILEVNLFRVIGDYKKEISVRFVYGEALTFYNYLINGQDSPSEEPFNFDNNTYPSFCNNMICTIQSGVLEDRENNLMQEFLGSLENRKPRYWLRGYNPEQRNYLNRIIDEAPIIYDFSWWTSGVWDQEVVKEDKGYRHAWIHDFCLKSQEDFDVITIEKNEKKLILDPNFNSKKISEMRTRKSEGDLDLILTSRRDILEEDRFFIKELNPIESPVKGLKGLHSVIMEYSNRVLPTDYVLYIKWLFENENDQFPEVLIVTEVLKLNVENIDR
jgi:hypothetical protein